MVKELLTELCKRGVDLWAEGDRLHYRAPKEALSRTLRAALAEHKAELIALLHQKNEGDRRRVSSQAVHFDVDEGSPLSIDQKSLSSNPKTDTTTAAVTMERERPGSEAVPWADIAVIGMGCCFPQAPDLENFWGVLRDGVDAITGVPTERWPMVNNAAKSIMRCMAGDQADIETFMSEAVPGKASDQAEGSHWLSQLWGGYLAGIDRFDPLFFGISPREARWMDPQQRIFLEVVWDTLEHAGYSPDSLTLSPTGVFVGVSATEWLGVVAVHGGDFSHYMGTGNASSLVANRVSYTLNLMGPSVVVDTACSSSLVALDMACRSVSQGQCDHAIVGGVSLILTPNLHWVFTQQGMLAANGRCKTFDARADGYVRGEGAGAVLVKRLEKAIADGDQIYAVIKSIVVNHDGHSKIGLMAPSPKAQKVLLVKAYTQAGIDPESVSYIEAHGTGTSLGDPIEIDALNEAFRHFTERKQFCSIGSVKTNIGHAESAAGIASLIKVILSMQHHQLPPSLHFEEANPHIAFEETPFEVNTKLRTWNAPRPLRAGVSSFSFGGTNAHVVLEEPPQLPIRREPERSAYLLPLSARTESALDSLIAKYQDYLAANPEASLRDLCYTASVGRAHFEHRLAIVVEKLHQLHDKLQLLRMGASKEKPQASNIFCGVVESRRRKKVQPTEQQSICPDSPNARQAALVTLAKAFVEGQPVDWRQIYEGDTPRRIALPTYPHERQRCWFEGDESPLESSKDQVRVEASLGRLPAPEMKPEKKPAPRQGNGPVFQRTFSFPESAVAREHWAAGLPIGLGLACVEMALSAGRQFFDKPVLALKDVLIGSPVEPSSGREVLGQVTLEGLTESRDGCTFKITGSTKPEDIASDRSSETEKVESGITPVRLETSTPGILDDLNLKPAAQVKPDAGQVEIRVHSAGLNFADVLNAMGLYPGGPFPLGAECAGTVVAVGDGVEGFSVGDEVIAIAPSSFSSFATTVEPLVVRKPDRLSFEEAATIPIVFLTSYYALVHVGRLCKGERVLIHSAAGGVGLAAVQIARQIGAEIFATAGNSEKREYLESIGIEHVMDSRTLDFSEEIMRRTNGEGVDVVLNSLSGEAIQKGLSALRVYGRFLEIGKTEIYNNKKLDLLPFQNCLTYLTIDLHRMCADRPTLVRSMFREIIDQFERGVFRPPPLRCYPIHEASHAFRHMAQRKNIGKIVLTMPDHQSKLSSAPSSQVYASGRIIAADPEESVDVLDLRSIASRCKNRVQASDLYGQRGLDHDALGSAVECLKTNGREVIGCVEIPESEIGGYVLHPLLIQGALQVLTALFSEDQPAAICDLSSVKEVRVFGRPSKTVYIYGALVDKPPVSRERGVIPQADVKMVDEQGRVQVALKGIRSKRVPLDGPVQSSVDEKLPGKRRARPVEMEGSEVESWFYEVRWRAVPRPGAGSWKGGTWLVFMDELGVGARLAEHLRAKGDTCIEVRKGESFLDQGEAGYLLNPRRLEDYDTFSEALVAKGINPTGVLHLWTCVSSQDALGSLETLEASLYDGVYSLLFLTKALSARFKKQPMSYWLVTSYSQAVERSAQACVCPERAALWGLGRVIPKEYTRLRCHGVDLETEAISPGQSAAIVLSELEASGHGLDTDGSWVAYRGGERLAGELVASDAIQNIVDGLPFRDGGVYLIAGGQGGVGLEVAKFIAQNVKARLVLINRTPLEEAGHPERVQGIRELEKLGSEVLAVAADVADLDRMRGLVDEIEKRWARIDGVIHSAGVLEDSLILNMDKDKFERVVRPKVQGSWVLDKVTERFSLDFFVLFSSFASFLAPAGQSNHVAASCFEDCFAHYRKGARAKRTLCINWGAWGETGVVSSSKYQQQFLEMGMPVITNADGLRGFGWALKSGLTQIGFFPISHSAQGSLGHAGELTLSEGSKGVLGVGPNEIAELIRRQLHNLAKHYDLDYYESFRELTDTLSAAYVVQALEKLGWKPQPGDRVTVQSLMAKLDVKLEFPRLMKRMLQMLEEDALLRKVNVEWEVGELPQYENVKKQMKALKEKYPVLEVVLDLQDRCGSQLAEVLTGKENPLGILFPTGSLKYLEAFYQDFPYCKFYNSLAGIAVAEALKQFPADRKVRILEIGAGTGGTTSHILPELEGHNVEYVFTDISMFFANPARKKFRSYRFVDYKVLNIEIDPGEQGLDLHAFDIVLAGNVLHATSDLRKTLGNVKRLLRPDGLLLLLEASLSIRWLDLVFGLLEGWRSFEDSELRSESPLLTFDQWGGLLKELGFKDVQGVPTEEDFGGQDPGQTLILARGPTEVQEAARHSKHVPAAEPAPLGAKEKVSPINLASLAGRVQKKIAGQISWSLSIPPDQLSVDKSFVDLGLDSLMAVEVTSALSRDLGVELTPVLLFEYPSIGELRDFLTENHGVELQEQWNGSDSQQQTSETVGDPEDGPSPVGEPSMQAVDQIPEPLSAERMVIPSADELLRLYESLRPEAQMQVDRAASTEEADRLIIQLSSY